MLFFSFLLFLAGPGGDNPGAGGGPGGPGGPGGRGSGPVNGGGVNRASGKKAEAVLNPRKDAVPPRARAWPVDAYKSMPSFLSGRSCVRPVLREHPRHASTHPRARRRPSERVNAC